LKQTRQSTEDISNLVANMSAMVERKAKQQPKKIASYSIIDELYSAQQQKLTLINAVEIMSPNSKQAGLDTMDKSIKSYGRQLKELQQEETKEDHN
jgi:hypothetical protein